MEIPLPPEKLDGKELEQKDSILVVTTKALSYLTNEFVKRGFRWLLPVILSRSTDPLWPDPGASIEKRVEVEIYGHQVRTTLSMIVHKLVACSLYCERLFSISPNIRIEKRERSMTGWHAYEFNQLDFEIRNANSKQVMNLVEELLVGLIEHLKNESLVMESSTYSSLRKVRKPFPVRDREDLVKEFGEDWERSFPKTIETPVWVVNIPREFYDFQDFDSNKWDNYDLFVPRYGEILSGAKREWEYSKIIQKMERDGVRKENYTVLLELARKGRLAPSAGAGIGVERLLTWMLGLSHIAEVQPFPRVPGIVYEL